MPASVSQPPSREPSTTREPCTHRLAGCSSIHVQAAEQAARAQLVPTRGRPTAAASLGTHYTTHPRATRPPSSSPCALAGPFSAPISISTLPYNSPPVLLAQASTAAVADTLTSGICGLDPAAVAGAPVVVFAYAETRPAGGSLVLSSCIPASTNAAHTLAVLSCKQAVAGGDGSDAAGAAGCTCARPDPADCAAEFGSTAKLSTASGGW